MSGAATIMAIAGAAIGAGTLGYGIYSGEQQAGMQKKAMAMQNTAQQEAVTASLNTERQSQIAQNEVNKQVPNVSAILQRAMQMGNAGISSTMLSGPAGAASGTQLGKATLLGS